MNSKDLVGPLRAALQRAAPDALDADLDRHAEALATLIVFARLRADLSPRGGTAPALKSLKEVDRRLDALWEAVESMEPDAAQVIRASGGPSRRDMLQAIAGWNRTLLAAHDRIAGGPHVPTPRGRPTDQALGDIASRILRTFETLTGSRAGLRVDRASGRASGPFLLLLHDVLQAIGSAASAEHLARRAMEKKRAKN